MDLIRKGAQVGALGARVALIFWFLAGGAFAQTPDSSKGVSWLAAQVASDGSLSSEGNSIATAMQAREEALLTLRKLGSTAGALSSAVAAETDGNVEYISRRVLAANAAGQSTAADTAILLSLQNPDSGWGSAAGYQSDPLDTAFALQALAVAGTSFSAGNSLSYLTSAALTDGGWGVGQSSVYVTANVLLAASAWSSQSTSVANNAASWLLAARNSAQEYGSVFDDALALNALATQASEGAALQPLISSLASSQLADGSWADDPYQTALALRAVWLASQPPVVASSGDVTGTAVDQTSGQPIAGVSVALAENAGITATTAIDGTFHLSNVPAATYTLELMRSGYQSRVATITVTAGKTLDVGSLALTAISTTATLSGVVKSNTGQLLQNVIIAAGSKSTLTDASGVYQITGINPGSATITATLSGYNTVSAAVSFQASTSYLFSPTLYPTSVTPPTTSLQGIIVDGNTNAPIGGAKIVLNGVSHTTDATGKFVFSPVAAGAYIVTISASGYQTVSASISVVAGLNDVGVIALPPSPTTSSLQGLVTDEQGKAIVNATVAVDNGPLATSDSSGAYQLSGLVGTQFTVRVSATGYITQTFAVAFGVAGNYSQDFHLTAQQTTNVTLGPITVSPASAGANTNLGVSTTLVNGGDGPFEGALVLEVRDSSSAVIGSGVLTNTAGFTIGDVVLQPGESLGILGRWNTGQVAAGSYQFEMRLVQPNSLSRSNPLGTLILNQTASFTITPTMHFTGTVAADPPVLQAGLNQAVDFSGVIKNDGNVPLPAQTLRLLVSDAKSGAIAFTGGAGITDLANSGLVNVDLGSWIPTVGGNYQLTISAGDPSLGSISGNLYVGNVAQATFTVNPDTVIAGTRTVHGNIHVTGVDPAQATITDPLAPLIRTAIQKAVTFNDSTAHQWIDANRCSSCHIGTQALLGGELTRPLTTFNALDRATIINNIATNQATNGGITAGYNDTSQYWPRLGTMALWGLLAYHDPLELQTVYKRAADWVVNGQRNDPAHDPTNVGRWSAGYYATWFDDDISMSMLNLSNLRRTEDLLRTNSITSVPAYSSQVLAPNAPASSRGFLAASLDGTLLYYTDRSNSSVNLIKPDGTLITRWPKSGTPAISDPRGIVVRPDGSVWLASSSGTLQLNADGTTTKLSSDSMDSLALDSAGTVWAVKIGDARGIYTLDASGKASVWLANGPFTQIGRITPDSDGSLYITDMTNAKIYRVLPDKSVTVVTEVMQGSRTPPSLLGLLKDGDHWLLATTNGIVRLTADWIGHRITWTRADEIRRLADGRVVYVGFGLANINFLVSQTEDTAGSLVNYAAAMDRGETWLRAQSIATADNLHMAQKLWGLGEAYRYYASRDASRATTIYAAMSALAAQLRTNQNSNGSWGVTKGAPGDSVATAQVGISLDYLNPSASDPVIRNAVAWLLSQQGGNGAWSSSLFTDHTQVSATTMVAIWLPMILDRLGAIDAQVSATFPANIQPGSIVPAPSLSSIINGSMVVSWTLSGVTNEGIDLGFDLTLFDLLPTEVRAVASDARMMFNNSFNRQVVSQPIDIPEVTAQAPVSLVIVTDQPAYPSNSTALVTTTLQDLSDVAISGNLVVNVYDTAGALVGNVTQRDVTIPAGGSLPVTDPFAIGAIPPAPYTARAVLSNGSIVLAQGQTVFTVLPDNLAAAATSTVRTDKQTYNPSDSVQILSKALSQSANVTLNDLSLIVTVYDAANVQQFTHAYSIPQLLPGQALDFSVPEKLTSAPAGIYTVKQDLFGNQGNLFNHVEAAYTVSSTTDTGFGLVGTIAATPKILPIGATVNLAATATNAGNGTLSNLPLTISIVDPATGVIAKQFVQTSSIAVGATVPLANSWVTQGQPDETYFAVLAATIGSGTSAKTMTLAVDSFQLSVHIDATVSVTASKPPLAALVLVDSTLAAQQRAQVASSLATINYVASFVTTAADFAAGVRSGSYQLYALLAAQIEPDTTTLRLLREAAHRGEGLLVANGASALPQPLADATGVNPSDSLPPINAQRIDVLSFAPGGAAHADLAPPLAGRLVVPQVAQTQAVFTGRLPSAPEQGLLDNEVAVLGRVDIGYFGTESGTNNTHLSLTSLGRIRNTDGTDRDTVWRIRNTGDTVRNIVLASVSGGYSQPLTIMSHTDSFIASPIVVGTADHRLSEGAQVIQAISSLTSVFVDSRLVDVGDNPGAIALWANHDIATDVLEWTGAQETVHGAIHSNADIRLSGALNVIDGPVHYVTSFVNTGSQNTFTFLPRPVSVQPLPTLLNLDDFKPDGSVATIGGIRYFDATSECASSKNGWSRNASQMPIASGVYWIPCDVHVSGGNGTINNVTIVSSGAMQIDGVKGVFTPYYQGLQFATTSQSAGAIQLSGDATQIGGVVFAPNGTVQVNGSTLSLSCSVIGDQIRFANGKTTIDARACPYATVQRTSPALLWNVFGDGAAAYAAFNWPTAIAQYEPTTPGELTSLFGGAVGEVAPLANPLRAGSILPLNASVQNLYDPFQGQLTLSVDDDSKFIPPTTVWSLDFTQQNAFSTQTNVRLGTGASTQVMANLATVTPLIIDPLRQTTLAIAHLPGDTIDSVIAAISAISSPDAGLSAALADLNAAKNGLAAGDREGALSALLDATEACAVSGNSQSDQLRTRIDWIVWSTTH